MSKTPYVPFYTSDFLGGTGGMTAATKGVYITLLCLMYESEAPLKQSWSSLARRCGASNSAFKKAVEEMIADGKIVQVGGGLWSEKCDRHIFYRREKRSQTSQAAKSRWQKTKQNQGQGDAGAMRSECEPEPEPNNTPLTPLEGGRRRKAGVPENVVKLLGMKE